MDAQGMLDILNNLDIDAIAAESVEDNVELIADLNASQLAQGYRADNTEILPSYRPLTVYLKKTTRSGLSAITSHVTLHDTGSFYKNLYAEVQGEEIEFGSKDPKSPKLEKKYSTAKSSIFGLSEDSKEELIESGLGKSWQEKITGATGLNFSVK